MKSRCDAKTAKVEALVQRRKNRMGSKLRLKRDEREGEQEEGIVCLS